MKTKSLVVIVLITVILLLIPFIAMQFTDEVNWTLFDFIVMGLLLLGTGILFDIIIRKFKKVRYRIAAGLVLLVAFLLIWVELSVGIFGTPFAGH